MAATSIYCSSWISSFIWPCKSNLENHFTSRLLKVKGRTRLCLTTASVVGWPYNYISYWSRDCVQLNTSPLRRPWCNRMTVMDLHLCMKGLHHIHKFAARGCVCVSMHPLSGTDDDPSSGLWDTIRGFFQRMFPTGCSRLSLSLDASCLFNRMPSSA